MANPTAPAHLEPRQAPDASSAAGGWRGVGRALRHLSTTVLDPLLDSALAAVRGAGLGDRQPGPARLAYDTMLEACDAALDQLATAPDPGVRALALLQLQTAHEAAALLACEIPAGDPDAHDLGPVGCRDLGMWQVHRITAQLCAHLATTERRLLHPTAYQAFRGGHTPLGWARPLSELTVTSRPAERARVVLTLGLLVDDGGRVTDQMHAIAAAYLHLAGAAPDAITALYDQIAGAHFGPTHVGPSPARAAVGRGAASVTGSAVRA